MLSLEEIVKQNSLLPPIMETFGNKTRFFSNAPQNNQYGLGNVLGGTKLTTKRRNVGSKNNGSFGSLINHMSQRGDPNS